MTEEGAGPEFQFPPDDLKINKDFSLSRNAREYGGGRGASRIDGDKKGETWATWMIPSKKEFESYSDEGKRFTRKVARRPDRFITPDRLQEFFEEVDDMEDNGEIPYDEYMEFATRLTERMEYLDELDQQRTSVSHAPPVGQLNQELVDVLSSLNKSVSNLESTFAQGVINSDDFLKQMEAQNKALIDAFSLLGDRTPPDVERSRWVDMEYRQEFYTQFDPRSEPNFYKNIDNERERRVWDYRWRLARIAFYKKATNAEAHKFRDHQDVTLFTNEMINMMLERVEGSKEMMSSYIGEVLDKGSTFWELIEKEEMDTERFDAYRKEMRDKHKNAVIVRISEADEVIGLLSTSGKKKLNESVMKNKYQRANPQDLMRLLSPQQVELIVEDLDGDSLALLKDKISESKQFSQRMDVDKWLDVKAKEADSVAWNTIYVSNLVEWADSRYTISGGRHGKMGLALASDDYRTVFHPQEKWEGKCKSGHLDYSPLVEWGSTQLERISGTTGVDVSDLELEPARNKRNYWNHRKRGGKVVVEVPEAHLTTSTHSFLHETKVITKNQKGDWEVDLDKFRTYRAEVEGEEEHPFGLYVATKFHKALQFNEFYLGANPLETGVRHDQLRQVVTKWSRSLNDLHKRLKPEVRIKELKKKGLSHQDYRMLKEFAVYASTGGMDHPDRRKPTSRIKPSPKRSDVNMLLKQIVRYY
jgi:cell division FtsZ-interacting protein ZapD